MADRHVRRSGDDYAQALTKLLPRGIAWPRDPESNLMKAVRGLAQIVGHVDARAADLLERETDPRQTIEMLADWERNFGLPDLCMGVPNTLDEHHALLVQRMTLQGGQSRAFFIEVASWVGFVITIEELSPIMGGISRGGEYRWEAGAPEIRYYWIVHIGSVPIWWFRGGVGEGGKDHHAEWSASLDLECLLRRYKPAHTEVIFDYNPPAQIEFSGYRGAAADAAIGTEIGAASLSGEWRGRRNFSLTDDGGGLFAIDATTGVVTVAGELPVATGGTAVSITVAVTLTNPEIPAATFTIWVQ